MTLLGSKSGVVGNVVRRTTPSRWCGPWSPDINALAQTGPQVARSQMTQRRASHRIPKS
jgi:hypothetical protein